MKILFFGCGNMGQAILNGILQTNANLEIDILVKSLESIDNLKKLFFIDATNNPKELATLYDAVIIGVKPQQFTNAILSYKPQASLIISLMAGKSYNTLKSCWPDSHIVRTMPNINLTAGHGSTTWYSNDKLQSDHFSLLELIFESAGKLYQVHKEDDINIAAAIAGSGPAYYFLFTKMLIEAGLELGLPFDITKDIAIQTFVGAGHLYQLSDSSLDELIQKVASHKGMTAKALEMFYEKDIKGMIKAAVEAGYKRGLELEHDQK